MPTATVTLSGEGFTGYRPGVTPAQLLAIAGDTKQQVKLGRRPIARLPDVPQLVRFVNDRPGKPIPARVDWAAAARESLGRMYLNDQYGDCVIAGKAHAVGVWTANDSDSGGEVTGTDDEIREQYVSICGPGDNGCYVSRVLDHMVGAGLQLGGKRYKLDGYVRVSNRNRDLVRTAIHLFGALAVGFNLPADWVSQSVWRPSNARIVGGHDVTAVGYDSDGVYVSSWGRVYLFTWEAFEGLRYVDECYAMLAPAWWNNDQLAPCGVDVAYLRAALAQAGGGEVPPIPDPPAPPIPPPAPAAPPVYRLNGTITGGIRNGTFSGEARPVSEVSYPDAVEFMTFGEVSAAALAQVVETVRGVRVVRADRRWRVQRDGLTPDQWQVLIAAIVAFLEALSQLFGGHDGGGEVTTPTV